MGGSQDGEKKSPAVTWSSGENDEERPNLPGALSVPILLFSHLIWQKLHFQSSKSTKQKEELNPGDSFKRAVFQLWNSRCSETAASFTRQPGALGIKMLPPLSYKPPLLSVHWGRARRPSTWPEQGSVHTPMFPCSGFLGHSQKKLLGKGFGGVRQW